MNIFYLPIISSLIVMVWAVIWLSAGVFIFSVGIPEPNADYPFVTEIKWDVSTRCIFIYYVFGLFWVNSFIISCT